MSTLVSLSCLSCLTSVYSQRHSVASFLLSPAGDRERCCVDKQIDDGHLKAVSRALTELKDPILEIWKARIREEVHAAKDKTKRALEDHIPELLDQMIITLRDGVQSGCTNEQNDLSEQHGRQRAMIGGYTREEVLEEYRIAREIIIEELNARMALSGHCQCLLNRIVDRAIIRGGTEFARIKNAENSEARLKALDAQAKAEVANQSKSDFLANMSHEIRTPLGAVLGFTELMRDPFLPVADRNTFADIVNRNGRRLSNLINDILDISKIEAGHLQVEMIPTSLVTIVAEVTTLLRGAAELKGIKLVVQPPEAIPESVLTDPSRLTQILTNMIGNAIKFTQNGEINISLERLAPDLFAFVVRDTGIGIAFDQQEKLFRSFSQADASTTREFGGTGLGLFLSKKLATALGGDIVLRSSAINQGSTFAASFQASELEASLPHFLSKGLPVSNEPKLKGVRILLAEDSPDNQLLVSRYLGVEGAEIHIANNGQEAVRLSLSNEYDIILMDIQMPLLDGYEATRTLREQRYAIPIIALTANAMTQEKIKALNAGCNSHLTKPIHKTELINEIRLLIGNDPL